MTVYDPSGGILVSRKSTYGAYITDAEAFDQYIADLMPVLQKRKEQAAESEGAQWLEQQNEIIIVISDHKRCFDLASNDTVRRLANIISLGKGLKVCLLSEEPTAVLLWHLSSSFSSCFCSSTRRSSSSSTWRSGGGWCW